MTYNYTQNPNYIPPTPIATGKWKDKDIEVFESDTYGYVVFVADTNEEYEASLKEYCLIIDRLVHKL